MLNKTSVKVLKALNKINYEFTSVKDLHDSILPRINETEIAQTLIFLNSERYLNCVYDDDENILSVSPEYKGQRFFEFRVSEFKEFLLKSFVTPIIVSFLTTIITLILTCYF